MGGREKDRQTDRVVAGWGRSCECDCEENTLFCQADYRGKAYELLHLHRKWSTVLAIFFSVSDPQNRNSTQGPSPAQYLGPALAPVPEASAPVLRNGHIQTCLDQAISKQNRSGNHGLASTEEQRGGKKLILEYCCIPLGC